MLMHVSMHFVFPANFLRRCGPFAARCSLPYRQNLSDSQKMSTLKHVSPITAKIAD